MMTNLVLEVPAASAAKVNEVEEAITAADLNNEDVSAMDKELSGRLELLKKMMMLFQERLTLQEVSHAGTDVNIKDETAGSAIIKSKVHASGADEVKLEDTASAVLKEVSHPAAEKVNSEDLSENGDTATKLPDVSKSPEQETADNDEASKITNVFQEAAGIFKSIGPAGDAVVINEDFTNAAAVVFSKLYAVSRRLETWTRTAQGFVWS